MKLLALTVLILTICHLEGALVRRQAEEPLTENVFSQYFQKLTDVIKEISDKVKAPEVHSQVQAYFEKSQEQVVPLAKKAFTDTMTFFSSLVESGKKAAC
ncbi:apolipoprotein A-II [Phascolarctos cinereus]|uniref:Apolipoprotein A-II n=1 Tax=Phascolarctos cinereus TaxID=38626 RepID=A0A6P5J324_PHACI|nr:apolipoprotein A-II [Phascolarctos cinereus]